jgi:hypothetical protein
MPYQVLPPLVVISTMFALTGGILSGVHYLAYGEKRKVGRDEFDYAMERRDMGLRARMAADAAAAAAAAAAEK